MKGPNLDWLAWGLGLTIFARLAVDHAHVHFERVSNVEFRVDDVDLLFYSAENQVFAEGLNAGEAF